jgi:hypothetical protein
VIFRKLGVLMHLRLIDFMIEKDLKEREEKIFPLPSLRSAGTLNEAF